MRVALLTHSNPFRLAVCEGILDGGARLVAVTEPTRRVGGLLGLRRRAGETILGTWPGAFARWSSDPIYWLCYRHKIRWLRVPRVRDPRFAQLLRALQPDLVVLSRLGEIVPPEVFRIPPCGTINIHCSLLPRLRGPTPIAGAILAGLRESGITIHFVDEGLDTGDIILQRRIGISATETSRTFCEKAAIQMRRMVADVVRMFRTGRVSRVPQAAEGASYFSIKKAFGRGDVQIDWTQPGRLIEACVRASALGEFACVVRWQDRRYHVLDARPVSSERWRSLRPGEIAAVEGARLVVGTGDVPLSITLSRVRSLSRYSWKDFDEAPSVPARPSKEARRGQAKHGLSPGERFDSRRWPDVKRILEQI